VIKSLHKGVQYEAKNYGRDFTAKDQASDYYLAIFDPDENKAYTIAISNAYQFYQEIDNFKELYGAEEDNEALKSMGYMN
jgi:hypothetical protein